MSQNIIQITRGDTFDFNITVYDELYGAYYYGTQPGDKIVFRILYPHQSFFDVVEANENNPENKEIALFSQTVELLDNTPNDDCVFYLEHEDTLKLLPGVYYYTVKLIRDPAPGETAKRQVLTIIEKTKFIVND